MREPKKRGAHAKPEAAEKENPQKGFSQNFRGPRTEHPPHTRVRALRSRDCLRDCKPPKGSAEPALKVCQNKRQVNPIKGN